MKKKFIYIFLVFNLFMTTPIILALDNSKEEPYKYKIEKLPLFIELFLKIRLWNRSCPLPLNQLSYITLNYWGFDDMRHQGSLIVNQKLAPEVAQIFKIIYENHFPIYEMEPTNFLFFIKRLNATAGFSCRPKAGKTQGLSLHAYGRAIDINPLINPYVKGQLVIPEEGKNYLDRNKDDKGMITNNTIVYKVFKKYGWKWGGDWKYLKDYMHFEKRN